MANVIQAQLQKFQVVIPTDPLQWQSEDMERKAGKLTIKTDKGLTQANELLVQAKSKLKEAKDTKEEMLKPVKEKLVNPITEFWDPIIKRFTVAVAMFRKAMGDYDMARERERRELVEALKQEGVGPKELIPFQSDKAEQVVKAEGGTTTFIPEWLFTIESTSDIPQDIKDEALNTKRGMEALDQAVRARVKGGARKISGVFIYEGRRPSTKLNGEE